MALSRFAWTLALTSMAWFLFALDRLVVSTALPAIRAHLGAGLAGSEWTVNAYPLTFAVLLLTGAALGDRFGRRRMFTAGMAVFTAGSVAAALAPTIGVLIAARAVQGAGGAIFAPLALTMLSAATPAARRGAVLGAWGGIGGLGAAAGPLLGGLLAGSAGWQWIFWLNVPLGLVLVVAAPSRLGESHGPHRELDLPGVVLGSAGMLGVVWGLVETTGGGAGVIVALVGGGVASALFVLWELRAPAPMLPMHFFRNRAFAAANTAALFHYAALFGALFLVSQLLQTGLGAAPLEAGLQMLPMVVMPMLVGPVAGVLSDRWGPRPLLVLGAGSVAVGLTWLAAVVGPGVPYAALVPGMALMGTGSALFFAPLAATVLSAVAPSEQGKASGVSTAVRELAVVAGVAVLGGVFAGAGDLDSSTRFLEGAAPAIAVAAAIATAGVLTTLVLPRRRVVLPRRPGAKEEQPAKVVAGR
jgi:EmrB/QacA subfamily drug resistance transporter